MFREFFRAVSLALAELIRRIIGLLFPSGPSLTGFSPDAGWPSMTIEIFGSNHLFARKREGPRNPRSCPYHSTHAWG